MLNSVFGCATSSPDATRIDVAELSHAYAVADPRATMVALSLIATDALRNGGVPIAADLLILAHSALSGTLDTATACYLHHRLGMAEAIPFSVSHCHAAGFLYAARIAADLTAVEPRLNSALIVCSDIWVDPLPRRHPPFDSTGTRLPQCACPAAAPAGRCWPSRTETSRPSPIPTELRSQTIRYSGGSTPNVL
ncbi:MAG: hypothetical protein M5U09_10045 [Gammaproteobacteria bacterium]|nr:hypothetical protein [Gammaproteobacteria bacterium]